MTVKEFYELKDAKILQLLSRYSETDPAEFALRHSSDRTIPVRAVAEQLKCRKKALHKLPGLSSLPLLYDSVALEQSSGIAAARFKASLVSGRRFIDLTGGLGIDFSYISAGFDESVYCEQQEILALLAEYNMPLLNTSGITMKNGDGISILAEYPDGYFDLIYADPARRDSVRRYTALQDYSPNVIQHMGLLKRKAQHIMIKVSPAAEIEEIRKALPSIQTVYIVSVDGECKEILLMAGKLSADMQDRGGLLIRSVCIRSSDFSCFILESQTGIKGERPVSPLMRKYFLEPDPAIIKARNSHLLCGQFDLEYINPHVDYMTTDILPKGFPGRIFAVTDVIEYGKMKDYLKQNGIQNASIARRGFPDTTDTIRKKLKLKDGGNIYLFFTQSASGRLISIAGSKIQ
ncbi:MAG: THUMP-like domain-containing protein [Bacteroidota bacterium]